MPRLKAGSASRSFREQVAARVFYAHMALNHHVGRRIPLAELGRLVAAAQRRRRSFSASTVLRWESGATDIEPETLAALATVCQRYGLPLDAGWLQFGETSLAPAPSGRHGERARASVCLGHAGGALEPTVAPRAD